MKVGIEHIGRKLRTGIDGTLRGIEQKWRVVVQHDGETGQRPIEVMREVVSELQLMLDKAETETK